MDTRPTRLLILGIILLAGILFIPSDWIGIKQTLAAEKSALPLGAVSLSQTTSPSIVYMPFVAIHFPWVSPFGAELGVSLGSSSLLQTRTTDLSVGWIRLNSRISWRALQPNEGDPIQWNLLTSFENELHILKALGLTPIVIVDDYPRWATLNNVRSDGQPTSCGPLRPDKLNAFAQFTQALVSKYQSQEFNVHHWELGNEPDVDPNIVPPDNVFGCWGAISDPYYGGRQYGEMLKVVAPAIKAVDPGAVVWIGGLLLDLPNTTNPYAGKPELFLKGILTDGAAPYFDIVPFHSYTPYLNQIIDYDNATGSAWDPWGGKIVGKANYLRQLMSGYNVQKPVFLNEAGLMCPNDGWQSVPWCVPPGDGFYQMQANYVVRSFVRALDANVMGLVWYTLDGPGWRYTGLLDANANPKPVYLAYQQLTLRLRNSDYAGPVNYGPGTEAYSFKKAGQYVDIVWVKANQTLTINVSQSKFIGAYDRDGLIITPTISGTNYQMQVGFQPIYVVHLP